MELIPCLLYYGVKIRGIPKNCLVVGLLSRSASILTGVKILGNFLEKSSNLIELFELYSLHYV